MEIIVDIRHYLDKLVENLTETPTRGQTMKKFFFGFNDFPVNTREVQAVARFNVSIDPCPQDPEIRWNQTIPEGMVKEDPRHDLESKAFFDATDGDVNSSSEFFNSFPEDEDCFVSKEAEEAFMDKRWRQLEAAKNIFATSLNEWVMLKTKDGFVCGWVKVEKMVNLTQHNATPDQVADGVVELEDKSEVQDALTFDNIPSSAEMTVRANILAQIAKESGCRRAMIGGAPFFMSTLERVLISEGITPVFAFSKRESVDEVCADGSVKKTNVFKHVGFVGTN